MTQLPKIKILAGFLQVEDHDWINIRTAECFYVDESHDGGYKIFIACRFRARALICNFDTKQEAIEFLEKLMLMIEYNKYN